MDSTEDGTSKKRPRDDERSPAAESNKTSPTAESSKTSPSAEPRKPSPADDLLTPLTPYDWAGFQARCAEGLGEVEAEEAQLLDEYHKWEWIHELWSSTRSKSESMRLSREIATIAQWSKLKEEEVEKAREQHTEDMKKISSVLGILSP